MSETTESSTKKEFPCKDEFKKYRSPLVVRYASPEMAFNFSEMKKFSTWRHSVLLKKIVSGSLCRNSKVLLYFDTNFVRIPYKTKCNIVWYFFKAGDSRKV